ncbi:MAG: hypothetical protein P9X24_06980 [Candidatus Hatepunaea meridiana]|nr:hypothetical protein [Candidatus Hatepunaea meridiana]
MSKVKKQIGDRVMITAGQYKDQTGNLTAKNRSGWTVELEDGQQVSASFPMVALLPSAEEREATETQQIENTSDASSNEDESSDESDPSSQSEEQPSEAQGEGESTDITKMTVKQLQALAKQRKIGIARTKSDFLRIIKEKNPDEDLDQLTGKTLFNRVTELHISRLRTKADLVRMLSA